MNIFGLSSSQGFARFTIYEAIIAWMPFASRTLKIRIITLPMPDFPVSLMHGFFLLLTMATKRYRHEISVEQITPADV